MLQLNRLSTLIPEAFFFHAKLIWLAGPNPGTYTCARMHAHTYTHILWSSQHTKSKAVLQTPECGWRCCHGSVCPDVFTWASQWCVHSHAGRKGTLITLCWWFLMLQHVYCANSANAFFHVWKHSPAAPLSVLKLQPSSLIFIQNRRWVNDDYFLKLVICSLLMHFKVNMLWKKSNY